MNNNSISLNESVLYKYFNSGDLKTLYIFVVLAHRTKGLGYTSIEEFKGYAAKVTGSSTRTVDRWISKLKELGLIKIKKGYIYPVSLRDIEKGIDLTKTYVKVDEVHLKSYWDFQAHLIQQVAYLLQRRFRHAWKYLKTLDAASLVKTGKIETELGFVKNRKQAGCSISKVQEKLGIDKMTISKALRGCTTKQTNNTGWIDGKIARAKYRSLLSDLTSSYRSMDYRWGFTYDELQDKYLITYSIASNINVESKLTRKRYQKLREPVI